MDRSVRITTLIENRSSPDDPRLEAEWGLSLCVELDGRQAVVDFGASDAFARNAERLSIDLGATEAAVLSHHHYDHGGGLRRFLELNDHAPIYLGPLPDGEPTAKLFGFLRRYIGLDRTLVERHGERFRVVEGITEIVPGLFALPCPDIQQGQPAGNHILFVRKNGFMRRDDFRHELVIAACKPDGLVVLTGCSHHGLLNMVETVKSAFPGLPVRTVVGGFHLAAVPPFRGMSERAEVIEALGRAVVERGVGTTYTCHCTGEAAFEVLRSVMGERVQSIRTGSRIEV
jgi:7,8-dihydropterin-6-yl-methyl-4-(beta-D-ribofuranosyl)aminobenzene 5'-phosphate synthase